MPPSLPLAMVNQAIFKFNEKGGNEENPGRRRSMPARSSAHRDQKRKSVGRMGGINEGAGKGSKKEERKEVGEGVKRCVCVAQNRGGDGGKRHALVAAVSVT